MTAMDRELFTRKENQSLARIVTNALDYAQNVEVLATTPIRERPANVNTIDKRL